MWISLSTHGSWLLIATEFTVTDSSAGKSDAVNAINRLMLNVDGNAGNGRTMTENKVTCPLLWVFDNVNGGAMIIIASLINFDKSPKCKLWA